MAEMSKYPLSDEQKAGILEDALVDARKLDARSRDGSMQMEATVRRMAQDGSLYDGIHSAAPHA